MPTKDAAGLAAWITDEIRRFLADSPLNTLGGDLGEKAWDEALVGFAAGDDPVFEEYCRHIGDFYWMPHQALNLGRPELSPGPRDVSVVAWVLPQRKVTRASQRPRHFFPSEHWARARGAGEEFNMLLRRHMVEALEQAGHPAVSPMLLPQWQRETSPTYGFASRWSERHSAYAAGLGTFGLCDGLITERGKAVRVGSLVVAERLPATPRPYQGVHDYCLFYANGTCGKCIGRCPVGALSEKGHDKKLCGAHTESMGLAYIKAAWGFAIPACGLCQCKVPCEAGNPTRHLKKNS